MISYKKSKVLDIFFVPFPTVDLEFLFGNDLFVNIESFSLLFSLCFLGFDNFDFVLGKFLFYLLLLLVCLIALSKYDIKLTLVRKSGNPYGEI